MAGLNDRRRLGTESGRIRREARAVARAGGNPSELLNRAAQVKLGEGSAISSSEENIAFDQEKRRMQSGLLESKRRALLDPAAARQDFDADLDRSASVKTDPAARQRAYDRGATLGATREQIDQRIGGTAPQPTGTAPPPIGPTQRPTLQGPPVSAKPGLIDGKPARSVLDSMRGVETEPGNLAGLASRDAQDRAAAITTARTESAGNPSVTRQGVIDRINKERTAKGLQPFGEDIYKDIANQDGRKAKAESDSVMGEAIKAQTPLQKSLAEARTRFAPPAEQSPLPVYPVPENQGPPVSAKPVAPKPPGLAARFDTRLNARFSAGPLTQRPTIKADRTAEEEDYKKRYKATPDLPIFPSDSLANRLFKSTLTRYTR
jgi:hypothetical protein